MKTIATLTFAAVAAFCSIAAQAQSTEPLSRGAVTEELQRARASGELDHAARETSGPSASSTKVANQAAGAPPVAPSANAKGRMDVQAELARARANGELDWAAAEINGVHMPIPGSTAMAAR